MSDGFAHALDFRVNDHQPGMQPMELDRATDVTVMAKVAFAAEQPNAVAYGGIMPAGGRRVVGDTRLLHASREMGVQRGGHRTVELVVNGQVVATQDVLADGQVHTLEFKTNVSQSSWIALRQFPQLHTNSVSVILGGKPIRASADSARWCQETIRLLWKNRRQHISVSERSDAKAAYDRAIAKFESIAVESR